MLPIYNREVNLTTMFKSKLHPIVIPQSEHEKLAGVLAFLWGNKDFELPQTPFNSFVSGIGLHDRGYGAMDNIEIGAVTETEWLQVQRRGFYMSWEDSVADLITRFHLLRLVKGGESDERKMLLTEMEAGIAHQLQESSLSHEVFERIDRCTDFCDRVAFDFCFQLPARGVVAVYPQRESAKTTEISYRIEETEIYVHPWPFSVETYSNYLTGYAEQGYPDKLNPVIVPYRLIRGT